MLQSILLIDAFQLTETTFPDVGEVPAFKQHYQRALTGQVAFWGGVPIVAKFCQTWDRQVTYLTIKMELKTIKQQ